MSDSEEDLHLPEEIQPTRRRRGLRWLAILGGGLLIFVFCLTLLLTYWFPSELVRPELEARLSELLEGVVRIRSLSFNLLTGLELTGVEFTREQEPLVKLEGLTLDYSLWELLQQRLRVKEVRIEGATVFLNLPGIQVAPAPQQEVVPHLQPPSLTPVALPVIPVTLDLDALVIRDSTLKLVVSPTLAVELAGLNLDVSGGVTEESAKGSGELRVATLTVDLGDKQLQLPLRVKFAILVDLPEQRLEVQELTIQSGLAVRLTLSGQVEKFLTARAVDASLSNARIDVERLLRIGKDFIPHDLKTVEVSGILSPEATIKGALEEAGFTGRVNATVEAEALTALLAFLDTTLESTDLKVHGSNLSIKENRLESGSLELSLTTEGIAYDQYSVSDLSLAFSGDYFAVGPVSGKVEVSGVSTLPPLGPLASLTLPFDVRVHAVGNHRLQGLSLEQLTVKLGNLLNLEASGKVKPIKPGTQILNVSLTARIEPRLEHILPLLLPQYVEGHSVTKAASQDFITVDAKGRLDGQYLPQQAEATFVVSLANLTADLEALPARGTLANMNLSLSVGYNAQSKGIQGSVSGVFNLFNLEYGGMLTLGQMELTLGSDFSGTVSPSFELRELVSKDTVTVQAQDLVYEDATLKAALNQLVFSSKTRANVFGQDFVIEKLRITSPPLFDMMVKGRYRLEEERFHVEAEVPYLNVGEVLGSVSGEKIQALGDMNLAGEVSLSVKASGVVPQPRDIERLDFPVELASRISLKGVTARLADHQANGARGTVSISYKPGDHPVAKFLADLEVQEIRLAPELTMDRISGLRAKVDVSSRDFDEVSLDQVRLSFKGADFSLKGKVTGVRDLLTGKADRGTVLGNLFAQVTTKASVDLDEFQDLLEPLGVVSSGQARVGLVALKKEKGPLDVRLRVGGRKMSVSQEGMSVENLDGVVSIRKQLRWLADSQKKAIPRPFNPTDVLARLGTVTGKQKSLAIERLNVGFLTVSNFSTGLLFDGRALKIQNMSMGFLGGGVGGNLVLTAGKAFGVSARFEAAHLDLNQLLEDERKIAGDSFVDGTIGLSVFFEEDTGALDLGRTEVNLFITHIGAEALDRLVVFLDPEGSNPTLVNARSQIKLANPSRVTLRMARGMLGLEIVFREGLLSSFTVDRIPVGRLKNLQTVTQGIPQWEKVRQFMALMGAQSYGFDSKGSLVFQ